MKKHYTASTKPLPTPTAGVRLKKHQEATVSQMHFPEEYRLPFKLNLHETKLTEEQFVRLCQENPDVQLELTERGDLVIMPPTGSETGRRNNRLSYRVTEWADRDGSGVVFDSSTLFTLPNGAKRSPDVSWVRRERWQSLTQEQREGFAPLCPDFVVELRSPTDRLHELQAKMQEYRANGAQLGWLIDPLEKRVYVYRPNQAIEIFDDPSLLSGDPVLPGFVLHVRELW